MLTQLTKLSFSTRGLLRISACWLYAVALHFLSDRTHQTLGLFPELLVHHQVDEEVADVVDLIHVPKRAMPGYAIEKCYDWHEADDVDDHYEDELHHSHQVTSVALRRNKGLHVF